MQRGYTLESKVAKRIARMKANVFLRDDFKDLADYDQVGRVLRKLATKERLFALAMGFTQKLKCRP